MKTGLSRFRLPMECPEVVDDAGRPTDWIQT